MKTRITAIITVIMMVISVLSLTTLVSAEDAYYAAEMETPNEYALNEVPLTETESSTTSESDNEQGSKRESNESDSSASDENTDSDIGNDADIGSSYDSGNNQSDDSYESENKHQYDDEQCKCECVHYCDYDCNSEYGYVEVEALSDFVVTDWDGLYGAFTNLMTTDGPYTVDIADSITMNAQLSIPAGRTVHLGGDGILYQPTANARHLTVGGALVLNDITLRGTGSATIRGGIAVNNGGELIMNTGSVIEGNAAVTSGGVHVDGGSFTMNGGHISNNTAHIMGGGISIFDSIFIMNGGTISENVSYIIGGGVLVASGDFAMSGGTIANNTAATNGGGMWIGAPASSSTTFTMKGGAITNNTATAGDGGGIFTQMHEDYPNPLTPTAFSNIIFEGGVFSENTAGNERYVLPVNYYERTFGHFLNNYDINFRGSNRERFVVTNLSELNNVFNNIMTTDGPYIVEVVGNITMNAQLSIPAGRTVSLTGDVLYQPTANARHFTVDGTLVLNGITLRGTGTATYRGGIMVTGGELIMNAGSVIENNRAEFGGGVYSVEGAVITIHGGRFSNNTSTFGGGAIFVSNSTVIMNDGVIENNVANYFGGAIAGGSHFGSGFESAFIMNGGTISGNRGWYYGGGVRFFNGNVTINGGTIKENETMFVNSFGGGLALVFVDFEMNGGIITGNLATRSGGTGGGVSLYTSNGTMNGGLISGNRVWSGGGGVDLIYGSTFIMNNGTINENESHWGSGGVGVHVFSVFNMNGGIISNNTGGFGEGGGVHVNFDSAFTMDGGTIDGNTTGRMGGGVSVSIRSMFTMNSGIIGNNTAGTNGGGVFIDGTNTFTMNGGTIDGNMAYENGGGIYLNRWVLGQLTTHYGIFSMIGGAITNNTTVSGDGGGIFSVAHENYANPLTPTSYHNIIIENGIISGNIAGTGRYALPTNYYERAFGHLLNNSEINFKGSYRVEAITFELNGGNVSGNTDAVESMLAYGVQVGTVNVPIVELFGYNLTGWLLGEELLTNAELAEKVVDIPMTFVAQWERILFTPCCVDCCEGEESCEGACCNYFMPCCIVCCLGEGECQEPCLCDCCAECGNTGCHICTVAQHRTIRIYYYLEGIGLLVNDTINDAIGREYERRAGSVFSLAHVVDRNELDNDNEYVFVGWRVYVDGVHNNSYISDLNVNQLRGSFIVPKVTGDEIGVIRLVAVWSIYEAQENGNGSENGDDGNGNGDEEIDGESNGNRPPSPPPPGGGNQQKLPQTGVESSMILWSAILIFISLIAISAGAMIRMQKQRETKKSNLMNQPEHLN
ncbi:MAG: hypothetical protein FWD05_13210 [Oscillospiraceae bacterium]|nr:hypothetical protein [Oscillospiraceae bacterium]